MKRQPSKRRELQKKTNGQDLDLASRTVGHFCCLSQFCCSVVFGNGSPSQLLQVKWSSGGLEAGDTVLKALSSEAWVRGRAVTARPLRVSGL